MKNSFFLFLAIAFFSNCSKKAETTSPIRKDITQAVYASGKIFPINDYKVYSKLPGYIEKIHVKVGDSIHIGDSLITIKSEVSELNVNAARNLYMLAQKNADEKASFFISLKQDVANAKSKFELDSINFKRFENLMKDNASSKMQFDQAKMQFDISKQNYLKALNLLNATRDKVKVELENAKIQYEAQQSNKSDYTLTAAVSGKIYDIIPKEGELINVQFALLEIGDSFNYEVELSIDETDVSLIKVNQEIVFEIDAFEDKIFKGKVIETYPRINQSNKTSKVIASIILEKDIEIYSGMTVEANIIIAEKKNALLIPREYIFDSNKVKKKGVEEFITIKKGASDLEYIEVLEGVDESTEIEKP